jgi:hypothetical protein
MGLAASVFTAGAAGGSYAAPEPAAPQFSRNDSVFFDVTRFGAVPDGKTKNTAALQRAIDACSAAGGGTVFVPPGTFLSGPLRLVSNLVLYLEAGSAIQGSPDLADYDVPASEPGGRPRRSGLISATGLENVTITGRGAIDGNALAFVDRTKVHDAADWDRKYTRQKDDYPEGTVAGEAPYERLPRPGHLIRFTGCRNLLLSGVTIKNSPLYNVHFIRCQNVGVFGVFVSSLDSGRRVPNDDGIDISGCTNMRISGCNVQTTDDSIAVFDTRDLVVSNCTLESRSSALRVGYGADTDNGEIRDCLFANLALRGNRGICVNVRGPYSVEHVQFSNIAIRTRLHAGHYWGKAEPIHISAIPFSGPQRMGHIRDVRFSDIDAEGEQGVVICGCPESVIRDVSFLNMRLAITEGPLQKTWGGNFDFRGTRDLGKALFEHDIPAIYAGHVEGFDIQGLRVEWHGQLPSFFTHAIQVEHCRDIEIAGFRGKQAQANASAAAIAVNDGSGVTVRDCRAEEGTGTFLALHDVADQRLFVNNDLARARQATDPVQTDFQSTGNRLPGKR